jgi:hypothetical protein
MTIEAAHMTESDWLSCDDPISMLELLRGRTSDRKLRLFAVACCRHLLAQVAMNSWDAQAVDVAERYADGEASDVELQDAAGATTSDWTAAYACAEAASPEGGVDSAIYAADNAAHAAGEHAAFLLNADNDHPAFTAGRAAEHEAQVGLVRCIFDNPFRPITIDPTYLTSDVVNLARTIYEERAFDRMPELADTLEEAGCHDAEILGHCHQPGPHVRGCWVVDAILGKA